MSTQLKLKKSQLRRKRAKERRPFDVEAFREKQHSLSLGVIGHLFSDEQSELKMSEVLLDFAAPFLEPDCSDSDFEKGLGIATITWNIATIPPEDRDEVYQIVLDKFNAESTLPSNEIEKILIYLIDRKLRHFNNIDRMITKHEVVGKGKDRRLFVYSTPLEDHDD